MPDDQKLDRRSVLIGALGGVVTGGGAGFLSGIAGQKGEEAGTLAAHASASASASAPASASASAPAPASASLATSAKPKDPVSAQPSFAQQGEDLVMQAMIRDVAGIKTPTYIDIGAYDPIRSNNTYLFYLKGAAGVLVEPNPKFAQRLREERPRDVVLEVGVGVTDEAEADYYLFNDSDGQLNTFSKEQADMLTKRGAKLDKVTKRQLVKINEILEKHFEGGAPVIFSIDVEGLDLAILKTMDFERWRPLVICTETLDLTTGKVEQETIDFLAKKNYQVRGGSFVNTIFLDQRPRPKAKK